MEGVYPPPYIFVVERMLGFYIAIMLQMCESHNSALVLLVLRQREHRDPCAVYADFWPGIRAEGVLLSIILTSYSSVL